MLAFRVALNGKALATGGSRGRHAISAIATSVIRTNQAVQQKRRRGRGKTARPELNFTLGGLLTRKDGSGAFVDWAHATLKAGDTLVLEVVDVGRADKPQRRQPFTAAQARRARETRWQKPNS